MIIFNKKRVISLLFVFAFSIAYAYAASDPKPVLYGQALDGIAPANGAIVTVYPQDNQSDTLTDTVGETGNTGLSSYWKGNLQHLSRDVQNGDIVVIHLTNGEDETQRTYVVNVDDGAVVINLNLNPAFQDYDIDGFFADVDCNDNNAQIYPDAVEVEDGVDNDCDGDIDEGSSSFDDDNDGFSENEGDCNDNNPSLNPAAEEICGDGIDQDCDGSDLICGFEVNITIFNHWTSFGLPFKPIGIFNSEQLGQAIMDATGLECDVIMMFDGGSQQMIDDILGLPDPSFAIVGTENYFVHCNGDGIFTYQGEIWE